MTRTPVQNVLIFYDDFIYKLCAWITVMTSSRLALLYYCCLIVFLIYIYFLEHRLLLIKVESSYKIKCLCADNKNTFSRVRSGFNIRLISSDIGLHENGRNKLTAQPCTWKGQKTALQPSTCAAFSASS